MSRPLRLPGDRVLMLEECGGDGYIPEHGRQLPEDHLRVYQYSRAF